MKKKLSMKKLLVAAMMLVMIGVGNVAKADDFTVGNLVYRENADHYTATIVGHANGTSATGELTIPTSIRTVLNTQLYVTDIADETFADCSGLTGPLVIPSGIVTIGAYAFMNCSGFTSVTFNDSDNSRLESIGYGAFMGCSGLTGDFIMPNSVTTIDPSLFDGCTNLKGDLILSSSIEYIPGWFLNDAHFEGVLYIPESVTYIGEMGLAGSFSVVYYNAINCESGLGGNKAILPPPHGPIEFFPIRSNGKLVIGEDVETIPARMFAPDFTEVEYNAIYASVSDYSDNPFSDFNCKLIIGESVETICGDVFSGVAFSDIDYFAANCQDIDWLASSHDDSPFTSCTGDLTVGEGVVTMKARMFKSCQFENVYFNAANARCVNGGTQIGLGLKGAFAYCSGTLTLGNTVIEITSNMFNSASFAGSLTIPNSVTTIEASAFDNCTSFNGKLTLGNSLVTIGNSAFNNCSGFTGDLILPNSVESIGVSAFNNCSGFTGDLIIPNSVSSMGRNAFYYCSGFNGYDLVLMNTSAIGDEAFAGIGFNRVFSTRQNPSGTAGDNAFYGSYEATLYVPGASIPLYQSDSEWGKFNQCVYTKFFVGGSSSEWMPYQGTVATSYNTWVGNDYPQESSTNHHVVILADCNMTSSHEIEELYVAKGNTFTIKKASSSKDGETSTVLTVNGTLENRGDVNNFVMQAGTQLINNSEDVLATVHTNTVASLSIGDPKWAFIASPMVDELTPTRMINDHFQRAMFRFNQEVELEWENMYNSTAHPNAKIINGNGYLFAHKKRVVNELEEVFPYSFQGELKPSGADFSMSLNYVRDVPFSGWNLVGNPFPSDAYIDKSYYVIVDGEAIQETPITDLNSPIPSCTGVFVVAQGEGESVRFSRTAPAPQSTNLGYLNISLLNGEAMRGSKKVDHATISFNDGDELLKLNFLTGDAKIYIPQGEKQYAIAVAEQEGELPLNFEAYKNGRFTIDITPDRAKLGYLHLIDNMTGANIDLLQTSSYSFEATTRDYASRFRIVFSDKAIAGDADGDNTFAYFNGSEWIIANDEEATLQVVDMMGRVLVSRDVINRFSTSNLAPGVYVLRLVNGENVKVQKVVIK